MDYELIEYKGQRVLMTQRLADSYGTDHKHISDNFINNKGRYAPGKHFFLLEGKELKDFKKGYPKFSDTLKYVSILYLWTEKGAWLQAKSLNTDEAWEAYELLVDDYYRIKQLPQLVTPSYMLEDPEERAKRWIEEIKEKKLLQEKILELEPKVNYLELILQSKGTVTTTQIAKDYGLSAQGLNEILQDEKVQYKQNKQWLLYQKHTNKGYTKSHTIDIVRSNGDQDYTMNTRWTQKGRLFIHEILTKLGYEANVDKDFKGVN